MGTKVWYEIHVETGGPMKDAEALLYVRSALNDSGVLLRIDTLDVLCRETDNSTIYVEGRDLDWDRSHEDRHKAVRDSVLRRIPSARVTSSWMDISDPPWDATFADEKE